MNIYAAPLTLLIGLICYFPPWKNSKVIDFGRICIWVGLSITVWSYARVALRLP